MALGSYEQFKSYFKLRTGIDLNCYKQLQMQRRIEQFITQRGFKSYLIFKNSLDVDRDLMAAFLCHLTINVSQFFRDSAQWEVLKRRILPDLTTGRTFLKVWSAGCSFGQEAYTLATILEEYFSKLNYSILASDIDQTVLKHAKNGLYTPNELQDMPPYLKKKYFTETHEGLRVQPRLQRYIHFRQQNLLTSSFDQGYDLICCRNVVIYFTEETKNNLYLRFSNALRTGGILFTGSTEQIFNLSDLQFKAIAPFFYQKTS